MSSRLPEIGLRGFGIHAMSRSECVGHVMDELRMGRGGWALLATLDHLMRIRNNEAYRKMTDEASLRVPDGKLLFWACRLQRTPLPEQVRGQDFLVSLCQEAERLRRSVFLLGGRPGTVEATAEKLREGFPELEIVGAECPEPGFERNPLTLAKLSRQIDSAKPDLVFVSFESPVQERVIQFLRHDRPETWWIGVGDRLYFVSGEVREAPGWMGEVGAEWMHELVQQPRRLFGRTLRRLPHGSLLLLGSGLRGTLPMGKLEGTYGVHQPSALIVDDDPHALDQLELLLTSRFPDIEVETRKEPDVSGKHDFYFLDNDFNGRRLAAELAWRVRAANPRCLIFGFSGLLDVDTLKRLINYGCDGVCDKSEPRSWRPILELMDRRLGEMRERHSVHRLGSIRRAAWSIRGILREWNERDQATRTAPPSGAVLEAVPEPEPEAPPERTEVRA